MLLSLLGVAALLAALVTSATAAIACLLIVVPAPSAQVAWWSIVASEGSLWIVGLAALGVVLSLSALALGFGLTAWAGLVLAVLSLLVAVIPPVQAAAVAWSHGSTIGLHPDLFGRRDGPAHLGALVGGDPRSSLDRLTLASPTTHVGPGTPPTLLVHGGRDQFIHPEQAALLAQRLASHGVPFRAVLIPYAHHAFDMIWNGWSAQALRPILLDFLRTHTR